MEEINTINNHTHKLEHAQLIICSFTYTGKVCHCLQAQNIPLFTQKRLHCAILLNRTLCVCNPNTQELWLLTREPVSRHNFIRQVLEKLRNQGIKTSSRKLH